MSQPGNPLSDEQLLSLNRITEQSSSEQLAWLSGYLWAKATLSGERATLVSEPPPPLTPTESALPITVISASQTGNARRIAQALTQDIERLGLTVNHIHAADYRVKQLEKEHYLIIVTSTQGEGDPPEEAIALYKFLNSKKAPRLTTLHYAVLGLGDRSYVNFCQAGKDIDNTFDALGATRLLPRIDADTDYQSIADNWRHQLTDVLTKTVNQSALAPLAATSAAIAIESCQYNKAQPFLAAVNLNQKITGRDSAKDVRHIELDLSDSGLRYQPGDTLGVWFRNSEALAEEILGYLKIAPNHEIEYHDQRLTMKTILLEHVELTQNTTVIVEQYAQLSKNRALLNLIKDPSALRDFVQATPLVDLFRLYGKKLEAERLLTLLRPLTPRLYSIASAQEEVGDEVHLTVDIVNFAIDGHVRRGGASGYLADQIAEQDHIKIFIERNDNFHLPTDNSLPIIMIGAGTGIAPFRAFIQKRANDGATGKNWLFFGNPHFSSDFLYQVEWQRYVKEGVLNRIELAWSRDQTEKVYVQDKILANAAEIWQWLQLGAALYVCGDANTLAKSVQEALLQLISQQGQLSPEQADEYLNELRINKRYQRDIY